MNQMKVPTVANQSLTITTLRAMISGNTKVLMNTNKTQPKVSDEVLNITSQSMAPIRMKITIQTSEATISKRMAFLLSSTSTTEIKVTI